MLRHPSFFAGWASVRFWTGLWEIVGHYGHNGYFQKFDRTIKDSYGYEGDDLSNSS